MRALARFLVRWHPKPWRARYEEEVLELLDANRVRLRDLFDLFKSGVTERVLSWYEPSQHITRFRLITSFVIMASVLVGAVVIVAIAGAPFAFGYALASRFAPLPGFLEELADWLYAVSLAVMFVCYFRLHRRRMARIRLQTPKEPPDFRLIRFLAIGSSVGGFLAGVSMAGSTYQSLSPVFTPLIFFLQAFEPTDIRFPGGDLLGALGRHRQAQYDLRWARMELDRCEGLYEGREAGPELRAARSEMERLLGEEAHAIADLDAMGYHARFQS